MVAADLFLMDRYLKAGPMKNLAPMMTQNGAMAEGGNNLWPDLVAHPDYDEFWQSRDIRRHLNNVNCKPHDYCSDLVCEPSVWPQQSCGQARF